jgi:excinuclease ABC subunit C
MRRPEPASIPQEPGSYQFKDADGRVIYVGKAKNLRSRVMSYFGTGLLERTRQMVEAAESVEWIAVRNEVEALFLEYNLIKRHRPRFNIRLKDDKSYPYLAVTVGEEWPRAMVMRGAKRKGVRYFGPYAHAYAIRETLDLLLRTFPIRTCTKNKFDRHHRLGRPCLYAHIEKCAAPCVGAVGAEEYAGLVTELLDFLGGDTSPILDRLDKQMHAASDGLEFERAARLRDQILMVRKAIERQQMVDAREEDYDAIGIAEDPLEASVQVFLVRKGRVVGRKGIVVDKVEDVTRAELVGRLLEQLYGDGGPDGANEVPREILVPEEPDDRELYEEFLGAVRESGNEGAAGRTGKVRVRVPRRGAKRALLQTVTQNAEEAFTRHKLRRASDHNARARALVALQDALGLPEAPLRIECYDISNLQGTEIVASMVVMEDGLPKRSDYRRFRLRHQDGQDDFASMEEVLTRRFRRYLDERAEGAQSGKRFAYPPNLVIIDGGKGQLGVATRVLDELGLEDIAVAGLAKRFEEVYLPGDSEPVTIPRDSEALHLLQQVRDEAHRFAITYHRQLRAKKMTRSVLDDVPGLGPVRRARLLKEHSSVKRLRELDEDDLVAIPWLPAAVARSVYATLHDLPVAPTTRKPSASTPKPATPSSAPGSSAPDAGA